MSYKLFLKGFRRIFGWPLQEPNIVKQLLGLCLGRRPVSEYVLEFHILSAQIVWNEIVLQGTFLHSLSDHIKNQIAARDESENFDKLINLAISIDKCFRECRREKNYRTTPKDSLLPVS